MTRGKNIFFIILGIGIIVLLIIYSFLKKNTYQWEYYHRYFNSQPYGHSIIDDIFDDQINATVITKNYLSYLDSTATGQKLIYIGDRFKLNQRQAEKTLQWVEKGNDLLIISDFLPTHLAQNIAFGIDSLHWQQNLIDRYDSIIKVLEEEQWEDDDTDGDDYYDYEEELPIMDSDEDESTDSLDWYIHEVQLLRNHFDTIRKLEIRDSSGFFKVTTTNPPITIPLYYQIREDTLEYWTGINYFDSSLLKHFFPEAKMNSFIEEGKVVEFSVKYGDGNITINSLPLSFTNLHMIRPEVWKYNQIVLGKKPDEVLYDKSYHNDFNYGQPRRSELDQSPLYFILSIPAFKWAWYILIGSAVTFFLFKLKREQAVIPVLRPNPNTSLEYAKAIGILRKNESDLFTLADEMYYQWETTLRNFYRTSELDETLKGKGFLVKYPEAKKNIEIINNYKSKLIKNKSLEPYEIKMVYNIINSLLNKTK